MGISNATANSYPHNVRMKPHLLPPRVTLLRPTVVTSRLASVQLSWFSSAASSSDPEDVAEARRWHQSFRPENIPKGQTTFSRSSGPGGQHVNKTESKATTIWPVAQLRLIVPKMLHGGLQTSKYYAKRSDSITLQAQTSRSQAANIDENHQKLFNEIQRLYQAMVPNETHPDKVKKIDQMKKNSNEARIREKKTQGLKKLYRKGSDE